MKTKIIIEKLTDLTRKNNQLLNDIKDLLNILTHLINIYIMVDLQ